MSEEETKNPVVQVAHIARGDDEQKVYTLSTGYKARILPVSASLIDQVTAQIKDPEVPMWFNEDKGRDEPNPSDTAYLKAMEEAAHSRGVAALDAMIMFGIELVDPIPEDDMWLKKLRKLGVEIDPEDDLDREFAFKKYIATSAEDLSILSEKSGMGEEAVTEAERQFRR